jgi:hypothetical protein
VAPRHDIIPLLPAHLVPQVVVRQVKSISMEEIILELHGALAGSVKTAKGAGLPGSTFVDW